MRLKIFDSFDFIIFISMILLITIGIIFIYSSGINSTGVSVSNEYIKQIIFASSGLVLMILVALFDYRKLMRHSPKLYLGLIAILIYTLIFGRYVNGARSWIGIGTFGIQPSEFGKILFIYFLAWYLERSDLVKHRKRFTILILILSVPLLLILAQPDLGTASVYIPIFLVMCFMAGIPVRYLMLLLSTGLLTVIFTVLPVWESDIIQRSVPWMKILTDNQLRFFLIIIFSVVTLFGMLGYMLFRNKHCYWFAYCFGIISVALLASIAMSKVLKPYQLMRLIVFIDPNSDPLGAGWNIIQSKIAIGSGNLFGQGFLNGTQSHYRFLPQQSTDFIFSILSEEWGFIGGIIVFLLYFIILFRIIFIIRNTKNLFGYYISSGILAMFFFHFIVNVGMVIGVMPITGIPLVFMSYGGSSLWTGMICVGILMSIHSKQLEYSL